VLTGELMMIEVEGKMELLLLSKDGTSWKL
jgi:hypothetical protein